jgi:hypothetical protein
MSSSARKIKRKQDLAAKEAHNAELTEEQMRLPSGKVITSPVRGVFQTFPLLGWVARRQKSDTPLVMLALALLRSDKMFGVLHVELPFYKGETDAAVVEALKRYGWKGGFWQQGSEEWPTGDPANEEQLDVLLHESASLKGTLTFPPSEEGQAVQEVEIGRARGSFLMPPLPEAEEPDEALIARLHELSDDYTCFYIDEVIPADRKTN